MELDADLQLIAEGREAEIFAWEDGTVLRLLRNPNAQQQVEREARAMRAATAAGVSVPAVHGTTTANGRPGLIMERIDGPDMIALIGQKPWRLLQVAGVFAAMQAQLHETPAPEDLPLLNPLLRKRLESSDRVPKQLADFAIATLDELPQGDRLCHGDFHPGNIIMRGGETVIIDWTAASRGDPTADYARTDLMLRLGELPPGTPFVVRALALVARTILRSMFARAYRSVRSIDADLLRRWEIPVITDRLADGIEPERPKLLSIMEKRLAANG